ncbi:MAG: DUF1294 domain-containing protein [Thermoplasmata archaeon]
MEIPLEWVLAYALTINLAALALFGIDKGRARKGHGRISEASLFLVSLAGGAVGGILGMWMFRHKTRKTGFKVAMAAILVTNAFLYYYLAILSPWFS